MDTIAANTVSDGFVCNGCAPVMMFVDTFVGHPYDEIASLAGCINAYDDDCSRSTDGFGSQKNLGYR